MSVKLFLTQKISDILRSSPKEDPTLNGLRALCVLSIMFFHVFLLTQIVLQNSEAFLSFFSSLPNYLSFALALDKSVDAFFLLSAYLLTSQLLIEHRTTGKINFQTFFIRRAFRIIPVFFLALIFYYCAPAVNIPGVSAPNLLSNLLFIANFNSSNVIPVGWSLDIEVQFYIALPFILLFFLYFKKYTSFLLIIFLLCSLALRYLVILNNPLYYQFSPVEIIRSLETNLAPFVDGLYIYQNTLSRFGPLVLGIAWAYMNQSQRIEKFIKSFPKILVNTLFLFFLVLLISSLNFPTYNVSSWLNTNFNSSLNFWLLLIHRYVFSIAVIGLMIIIYFKNMKFTFQSISYKFLSLKFWNLLAKLSYPIYLFHIPCLLAGYALVLGSFNFEHVVELKLSQCLAAFVLGFFICLPLSFVIHILLEKPCLQWGKKLTLKKAS